MKARLNNFVQETPVSASLLVLSQRPGSPDDNRFGSRYTSPACRLILVRVSLS